MKKLGYLFLCMSVFFMFGCQKQQDDTTFEVGYKEKYAVKEMDNGWHYIMVLYYDEKDNDVYDNAYLTGVNVKYKSISEDKGVPITNEDGEVLDYISRVIPDLKDVFREDLEKLHDFLVEKKFTKDITVDDLKDISMENIDKQLVVDMFNDALHSDVSFGKYGAYAPNCVQKIDDKGNTLQLSYITEYGNIVAWNVEYIYADGSRLSELNDSEHRAIQEGIDAYEDEVVSSQDIYTNHEIALEGFDESFELLIQDTFSRE